MLSGCEGVKDDSGEYESKVLDHNLAFCQDVKECGMTLWEGRVWANSHMAFVLHNSPSVWAAVRQ